MNRTQGLKSSFNYVQMNIHEANNYCEFDLQF